MSNAKSNIILALLVVNLLATLWLGVSTHYQIARHHGGVAEVALPQALDAEARNKLLERFTRYYNTRDYDAIYDMFGDYARSEITREQLAEQYAKLVPLFGEIEGGEYSRYTVEQRQQGIDVISLVYAIRLGEGSRLGSSGSLKIKLFVRGEQYEIYGISIDSRT